MPTIDLGALQPEDVEYTNVPCSSGTCTLILAGSLPLKDVIEGVKDAGDGLLYSEGNINYIKKCFKIKTDPKLVDDAFGHIKTDHLKLFNEGVTKILAAADSADIEDIKKKTN